MMTKEELLAFEYGKTFDTSLVPDGYQVSACFDSRMNKLVNNSRTEKGMQRNQRNMNAWYEGLNSDNRRKISWNLK